MTRCDELNRWLDEGMLAKGAATARAHAASCAACTEALEAFETLERTLALPAVAIPEGTAFTARVMEQVRAAAPLAVPEMPRVPQWLAILREPGFAVAVAAAVALILTPAAVRLYVGQSVALPLTVAFQSLGAQLGATLAGWFDPASFVGRLNPLSRVTILAGFTPLLVWAGLWMFGAVERLVRGVPARRG